MTVRKICVVTESRASYGYCRRIIKLLHDSSDVDLSVLVTGMHLFKEFGYTVQEVEQDGFPIVARADMFLSGDSPTAWAKSLGVGIQSMAQIFDTVQPDIVLISGDRGEVLAATVAAAYMNIGVAHIQSGDLSGHIDGAARHAITKLAHIHFPSCSDSAERVAKLGEEPWRIFTVGAPQLDELLHGERMDADELSATLDIDVFDPFLIVVQHPVLAEVTEAHLQMIETMEAIKELGIPTIVVHPNFDSAGTKIIEVIKQYEHLPNVHAYQNLDRPAFIGMLERASAIVGNSSCGILEAPSFKLPAIDIGTRQRGRLRAANVISVGYDRAEITAAIRTAMEDHEFKERVSHSVNPYGDGQSAPRIARVLSEVPLGPKLLHKTMTY